MRANEFISESVAGPKNCWPGHRKTGTQPGTGKNKGKRVNDCKKIKKKGVAEALGSSDYDKILNAIAALYGDDIWDNDAMQNLANDLKQAGPTDRELDFIIAKGKLPRRLSNTQFTNNDDIQFGEQGAAEGVDGEYDDEAGMAESNLHTLSRAVNGLIDTIDENDNLPEWCQEKIAKAEMMLVSVWDYLLSQKEQGIDPSMSEGLTPDQMFDIIEEMVENAAAEHGVDPDLIWEEFESVDDTELFESAAWRRKEGKSKKGGLNAKGVASYRRENPGSKLQTAVTTKPSKLKKGSKAAKRRKSFCARMGGVKGPMKKPNGKPTRKALALRKWNC